ncbi:MAG TPA: efflux RND transporter periplasmic adaptor subunit [Anaerolineales bacterium]|nr:efflux RND transporter periplasmic adaptor subunit [Anaerolineales bacterium]
MKHPFLIELVILAVLAAGCSSAASTPPASQADTPVFEQNQAQAGLGSITLSATGAGSLVASNQTDLSFIEGGTLVELGVQEGDEVAAGSVLARLQVDLSAAGLDEQRSAAELAVLLAQRAVDTLISSAELESAQALIRLETAQLALEEVEDDAPALAEAQQAVAEAKSAVEDAEMQVYISQSSASSDARYTAYAALLFKQQALADIEKQVSRLENQIKSAGDKNSRDRLKHQMLELEVRLANHRLVVNVAQAKLDALDQPVDEDEAAQAQAQLAAATAQLADAERQLEQVTTTAGSSARSGAAALAQAELNEAQTAWEQLQNGPDPETLALAEAALKEAEAKLSQVKQTKLTLELVTPVSGTVLGINYTVGDWIAQRQTTLTVGDMAHPGVEVYLAESDMSMAQVGAQAGVVFDVLPETTLSGVVTQVDPALITAGNAKTGRLVVELGDLSALGSRWLPVGLNASVDVIGDTAENVVLVPIEALQEDSEGDYGVYLVQDEAVTLQPVTIGLMDATRVEILTGLEAGQTVLLGEPTADGE